MKFSCTIEMAGAAFVSTPEYELTTILDKIRARVALGDDEGACVDTNGNTCGRWSIEA